MSGVIQAERGILLCNGGSKCGLHIFSVVTDVGSLFLSTSALRTIYCIPPARLLPHSSPLTGVCLQERSLLLNNSLLLHHSTFVLTGRKNIHGETYTLLRIIKVFSNKEKRINEGETFKANLSVPWKYLSMYYF